MYIGTHFANVASVVSISVVEGGLHQRNDDWGRGQRCLDSWGNAVCQERKVNHISQQAVELGLNPYIV